ILAATIAFAAPVLGYAGWFETAHGNFALTDTSQAWLYGRTLGFADCKKLNLAPELAALCPDRLPPTPGTAPAYIALWDPQSAFNRIPGGITGIESNRLAAEFSRRVITAQPADYAQAIIHDTF